MKGFRYHLSVQDCRAIKSAQRLRPDDFIVRYDDGIEQ